MIDSHEAGTRGFTLLELLIVISVVITLMGLALPQMITNRKSANEISAIASLRRISSAEEVFHVRANPPRFGALEELRDAGLLDPLVAAGAKGGYTFHAAAAPSSSEYAFVAAPDGAAGDRRYYVDQTGVIRCESGVDATASSPPLK
ncbi:MAG TPA: type II secretion system protein [Armatimonadota bacterium]